MSSTEIPDDAYSVTFREGLTDAQKELARKSAAALAQNAKLSVAGRSEPGEGSQNTVSGLQEYSPEGEGAVTPFVLAVPPPFDFGWAWHAGQAPYRVETDNNTGKLLLQARLGNNASTYSHVHAGFGIFLRTDRPVRKRGAAGKRALIRWQTQTSGPGTHALSEGGMEYTVLENGVFHGVEVHSKLWRKRVSIDEEAGFDGQMTQYWDPRTLDFSMEPGRDYTFNVGFWITCDRSFGTLGVGAAQCQGWMEGAVENIAIIDA